MRAVSRTLALLVLAALTAPPAWAISNKDRLLRAAEKVGISPGSAFDAMADAIADTAARQIPVVAASAGFTYAYNPELEVFERSSETLGPIFVERPDTIGRGKWNVNVSWQYVQLDEYDGVPTSDLDEGDPIITRVSDVDGTPLRLTASDLRYNFRLISNVVAVSVTYGILDDLDVNLLLPLIETDFDVTANRQRVSVSDPPGSPFSPLPGPPRSGRSAGDHFGVGDLLLRAKYQLPRWHVLRSALGLQLRLPSGSEDELQGTGTFETFPFLALSTILWGRVEPHGVLGLDLRTDDVSRSSGVYQIGVDADVTRRIGVTLDMLGRSEFGGTASKSATSFQYLTPEGPAARPLLGMDFGRKDYLDFSFGARAVVWRQIMVFANGIWALNEEGLRSSHIIPTFGVEGTF